MTVIIEEKRVNLKQQGKIFRKIFKSRVISCCFRKVRNSLYIAGKSAKFSTQRYVDNPLEKVT